MESLKQAQKFVIDNDLSVRKEQSKIEFINPNPINIGVIRVKAANEIRLVDEHLNQIETLRIDDYEKNNLFCFDNSSVERTIKFFEKD